MLGVCEVPGNELDLEKEMGLIAEKLELVKKAGHGEVIIKIADGKVVYITHTIGEKVKTK